VRVCVFCGGSLAHRRKDARYCGAGCRAAASRALAAEPARDFWSSLCLIRRRRSVQKRSNGGKRGDAS
jgi:hypothetical protein